jgi:Uma2 family endonuclease
MTQAKPRFNTFDEFLDYHDGTDAHYELVNGVLVELPTESWDSSTISIFLLTQFLPFVAYYLIRHKDTELAVNSTSVKARIPDLMVVTEATAIEMTGQKGLIPLETPPPVLVVEVVSPGEPGTENYDRDYIQKRTEYAARGILEYWLIDPHLNLVLILELQNGHYIEIGQFRGNDPIASSIFPALRLTAEQILSAGKLEN